MTKAKFLILFYVLSFLLFSTGLYFVDRNDIIRENTVSELGRSLLTFSEATFDDIIIDEDKVIQIGRNAHESKELMPS